MRHQFRRFSVPWRADELEPRSVRAESGGMSRTSARRSYGTGSLYVRTEAAGRESWYGQWRIDGRLVKRRVGAKP